MVKANNFYLGKNKIKSNLKLPLHACTHVQIDGHQWHILIENQFTCTCNICEYWD